MHTKSSAFFYACYICLPDVRKKKSKTLAIGVEEKIKAATAAQKAQNKQLLAQNAALATHLESMQRKYEEVNRKLELSEGDKYGQAAMDTEELLQYHKENELLKKQVTELEEKVEDLEEDNNNNKRLLMKHKGTGADDQQFKEMVLEILKQSHTDNEEFLEKITSALERLSNNCRMLAGDTAKDTTKTDTVIDKLDRLTSLVVKMSAEPRTNTQAEKQGPIANTTSAQKLNDKFPK